MSPSFHTIPFDQLELTHKTMLPMLGGETEYAFLMHEYLDEVFKCGNQIFQIKGGLQRFDKLIFTPGRYEITVNGVAFSVDKVVYNMLKKSEEVVVFVCTAGEVIHRLSKVSMNEGDLLKGYVYDLLGSVVVETAMDHLQKTLKSELAGNGLKITNRYSPGYCGWDVTQQKQLFSILPPSFDFVRLTESCMMQPMKSVSGFIGIGANVRYNHYTCQICNSHHCLYRDRKISN